MALPQHWVVKCERSEKFLSLVRNYLNKTFNNSWDGNSYGAYYGTKYCTGNSGEMKSDCSSSISAFRSSDGKDPAILTLDEFERLLNEGEALTNYSIC